jgi:hypothetical protein
VLDVGPEFLHPCVWSIKIIWCYDSFDVSPICLSGEFLQVMFVFPPHKTAKNKSGHPWIDAELKKQIRRQQRLYKKMKKTGDPDIKKAYRKHKHHLQKLTRQAYWRYIEGIITPDDLDRPYTGMKKLVPSEV